MRDAVGWNKGCIVWNGRGWDRYSQLVGKRSRDTPNVRALLNDLNKGLSRAGDLRKKEKGA